MPFAPPALRRLALAVAVLYDVDLLPQDDGLVLTGERDIHVGWAALRAIVESAPEANEHAQLDKLAAWLVARRAVAVEDPPLVALGIPADHESHPGAGWVRETIPGDALCLGFGYGADGSDGTVLPVPPGVLEHARIDVGQTWQRVRVELERLGTLAAERERRQTRRAIRPFGSADVVTLLGSASLRRELVATESDGMIGLIVPLRARGWRATYVSDPAYGPALAAAMPELERGFDRPLLVTAEEISEVRAGGDPMRLLRAEQD